MKSIKPGRGPSFLSGFVSICMALFGLFWFIAVLSMGGGLFACFGLIFVAVAVGNAVYSFRNATGQSRYSAFDITDGEEEPDPLNQKYGKPRENREDKDEKTDADAKSETNFCPYCGEPVSEGYQFCRQCGKKLP